MRLLSETQSPYHLRLACSDLGRCATALGRTTRLVDTPFRFATGKKAPPHQLVGDENVLAIHSRETRNEHPSSEDILAARVLQRYRR